LEFTTRFARGTEKRFFSFAAEKGGKRKTLSFAKAEHNGILNGHTVVSNSEMSNFSQDQGKQGIARPAYIWR
jgi:hypothetical protein